ncbi:MAG TPA: hypothetical protein VFN35_26980, partial [Ktedonobacteraceae bacterium]|nr:hypothetical protein [Ktedonobacteraceae bacterium]
YSLEGGLLITPAQAPSAKEQFERYRKALERWLRLCKDGNKEEKVLAEAIAIQQDLLWSAEEIFYPFSIFILEMLVRSQGQSAWQTVWQTYLSEQMESDNYQRYQYSALLWSALFPEPADLITLTARLQTHLAGANLHQRFSRRFLLKLVGYLRDLRESRNITYVVSLEDSTSDLSDLNYLMPLKSLSNLNYLRDLNELESLGNFRKDVSYEHLTYLKHSRDLSYLCRNLFTPQLTQEIDHQLINCSKEEECLELLLLMLGRVLQIQEGEEVSPEVEAETQHLLARAMMTRIAGPKAVKVIKDLFSYLPARTKGEIEFIIRLSQEKHDADRHRTCALALLRAQPCDNEAWEALEAIQTVGIDVIEKIVKARLKQREKEKQS